MRLPISDQWQLGPISQRLAAIARITAFKTIQGH